MHCNHCKKEEETVTIAGRTYCAECSNILSGEKMEQEQGSIYNFHQKDSEIRTYNVDDKVEEEKNSDDILRKKSKDELGSSAILLDILEDKARENLDKKTLRENTKLENISMDILESMNDSGKGKKRVHMINGIEKDIDAVKKPISDEKGYTKEYDILIIFLSFTAILLIAIAVILTFREIQL